MDDDALGQAPANTPAPAAPLAPVSAVEAASAAARAAIAQSGSALPAGAQTVDDKATVKREPNRAPDGKFHTDKFAEVGRNVPAPDDEPDDDAEGVAPEAGHEEEEEEEGEVGSEPQAAAQRAEAGAESEGEEGEGEAEGEEGEEGETLAVALPGRRPEDPAYEIEVDDPQTAERLRQLVNSAMRGDEARQYVEERLGESRAVQDAITTDPAGFLMEAFGSEPEILDHVALSLISNPKVWERVAGRVLNWDDPDRYELDSVKIANQQHTLKDQLQGRAAQVREVEQNFREVSETVEGLIPEQFGDDQRAAFFRDALRDLKDHADQHRLRTLRTSDIPLLLASRLKAYGINPLEAASRVAPAGKGGTTAKSSRNGHAAPRERPQPARQPATKPAPKAPTPRNGKQFVASAKRRQAAASIAPVGAGAPSNVPTPPAGQSVEERVAWHRKQLKIGRKKL